MRGYHVKKRTAREWDGIKLDGDGDVEMNEIHDFSGQSRKEG